MSLSVRLLSLCSLVFTACAGMQNPARPLPTDPGEGAFQRVRDGTQLFVHTHATERRTATTTVYLMSGVTGINHRAEADVIALLGAGAHRVVVIHPRGTGYSEGTRGDLREFDAFIADHVELIERDAQVAGTTKRVLFGHSMSTALAVAVAERLGGVDGVILVNPPFRLKNAEGMSPGAWDYLKYAAYMIFAPHTPVVDMGGDPARIENPHERREAEARSRDPLLVRYFSMNLMLQARKLMDGMVDRAKAADCPLLLVYGAEDGIVDRAGCEAVFDAWSHPDKRFVTVPEGPHGKLTVLKAGPLIQEWIGSL